MKATSFDTNAYTATNTYASKAHFNMPSFRNAHLLTCDGSVTGSSFYVSLSALLISLTLISLPMIGLVIISLLGLIILLITDANQFAKPDIHSDVIPI